jgi:diguanylate cyclase (GGDEF)-like protein
MTALGKDSSTLLGATPRLHSAAGTLDDLAHRAMMARAIAFLFAAGATLTLAVLAALPHPEADVAGMLGTAGVAYGAALVVLLRHARIAPGAYPWIVALGTVLITFGIHFSAAPTAAHALFYLWGILYSGYFLSRLTTLAQVALAVGGSAVVLQSATPRSDHAPEEWLLTVGALLVACVLIFALRRHVDMTVGGLANAARTDALTGLLNRRGFEEAFELELERARRGGRKLSVVIGDLDHFKQVNDRHGHLAGDSVLVAVAAGLRAEVRDQDLVGRFGGEEFIVLLAGVDVADVGTDGSEGANVLAIAERMRAGVAALRVEIPTPDGPLQITGLTASIGAAIHPRHGADVGALVHAADAALYAAKRAGRNTVRLAASAAAEVFTRPEAPA